MLPEGGPAHQFGCRLSGVVTQKRFKLIGKTNTFEDFRYPANPCGYRVAAALPEWCSSNTLEGTDFG